MSSIFKKIIPGKKKGDKKEKEKPEVAPEYKTAPAKESQVASPSGYAGKSVLKEPLVTEKSRDMSMNNKYIFEVKFPANKSEIKKEVEKRYGVTVKDVNITKKKIRPRQFRGQEGKTKFQKKAIVTVKEGDKIDIFPA